MKLCSAFKNKPHRRTVGKGVAKSACFCRHVGVLGCRT
uniref:DD31 n=1 Tax=Rattus norvegicus TaxID=10116 RepID=Q6DNC6_RAT|nr:DD31 [Rattus norvegicus]